MSLELIKDVEIGKIYSVPCVKAKVWYPIIPILHNDKQFGTKNAKYEHYHYDLRFMSIDFLVKWFPHEFDYFPLKMADLNNKPIRMNTIFIPDKKYYEDEGKLDYMPTGEIVYKRRKCYRNFTGIVSVPKDRINSKMLKWYQDQKGKSCKDRICPHRKMPMIERDGVLECVGHGNIGCPITEKIIGNIHNV